MMAQHNFLERTFMSVKNVFESTFAPVETIHMKEYDGAVAEGEKFLHSLDDFLTNSGETQSDDS